jgi:hypothetical protein
MRYSQALEQMVILFSIFKCNDELLSNFDYMNESIDELNFLLFYTLFFFEACTRFDHKE